MNTLSHADSGSYKVPFNINRSKKNDSHCILIKYVETHVGICNNVAQEVWLSMCAARDEGWPNKGLCRQEETSFFVTQRSLIKPPVTVGGNPAWTPSLFHQWPVSSTSGAAISATYQILRTTTEPIFNEIYQYQCYIYLDSRV